MRPAAVDRGRFMVSPRPHPAATSRRLVAAMLASLAVVGLGSLPADALAVAPTRSAASTRWGARPVAALLAQRPLRPTDRAIFGVLPADARVALTPRRVGCASLPVRRADRWPPPASVAYRSARAWPSSPATTARAFLRSAAPLFGLSGSNDDLRVERSQARLSAPAARSCASSSCGVVCRCWAASSSCRSTAVAVSSRRRVRPCRPRMGWRPGATSRRPWPAAPPQLSLLARRALRAVATESWPASRGRHQPEGLAILDPRLMGGGGPPLPRVVLQVDARAASTRQDQPTHRLVFVDALNGAVLDSVSRVEGDLSRFVRQPRGPPEGGPLRGTVRPGGGPVGDRQGAGR